MWGWRRGANIPYSCLSGAAELLTGLLTYLEQRPNISCCCSSAVRNLAPEHHAAQARRTPDILKLKQFFFHLSTTSGSFHLECPPRQLESAGLRMFDLLRISISMGSRPAGAAGSVFFTLCLLGLLIYAPCLQEIAQRQPSGGFSNPPKPACDCRWTTRSSKHLSESPNGEGHTKKRPTSWRHSPRCQAYTE